MSFKRKNQCFNPFNINQHSQNVRKVSDSIKNEFEKSGILIESNSYICDSCRIKSAKKLTATKSSESSLSTKSSVSSADEVLFYFPFYVIFYFSC